MQILMIMSTIVLVITFILMMFTNFVYKKKYWSSSKKISLWMWIWSYYTITFTFFSLIIFNCDYLPNVWCWNCTNFTYNSYSLKIKYNNLNNYKFYMFLLILIIGLYHEWNQASLQWAS